MNSGEYENLESIAREYRRLAYAAKRLADTGKSPRTRADLTGWTDQQKLERQREQSKQSMRRKQAALRAAALQTPIQTWGHGQKIS